MYIKLPQVSTLLRNNKYTFKFQPSATNLICNIINSLDIKTIAIPSFLCEEILVSINLCKIVINYYELDDNLNPIFGEKHHKSDCLFICDYFGYPINLSKDIKLFFSNRNKITIFDRSHSLLAGIKEVDKSFLNINNKIFLIYSLRKFIPTINGALIISNTNLKKINYQQSINSKSNILISFISTYLKSLIASNKFGREILARRQVNRIITKKNLLNGYKITRPNLKKEINLGYFNKVLDPRNKRYINKLYLKKLKEKRFSNLLEIKDALSKFINSKDYEIEFIREEYGVPYGLVLKCKKIISKKDLEESITVPLLKKNNKAQVILWPYNSLENYNIEETSLKSRILIIPRVTNV